mmetsp:Transcript_37011/g.91096  ORF Transcript_37011/g.91096 Transcript_37011/m.91096 type:complete len:205 (-) Transcript_37011:1578-2192(-)
MCCPAMTLVQFPRGSYPCPPAGLSGLSANWFCPATLGSHSKTLRLSESPQIPIRRVSSYSSRGCSCLFLQNASSSLLLRLIVHPCSKASLNSTGTVSRGEGTCAQSHPSDVPLAHTTHLPSGPAMRGTRSPSTYSRITLMSAFVAFSSRSPARTGRPSTYPGLPDFCTAAYVSGSVRSAVPLSTNCAENRCSTLTRSASDATGT